jgi:hypothetical protein
MAEIFISYAREDEARIQPFVRALENEGWSVFWDRRIPAGQTWRSYIGKALSNASCVIVAWSLHSIGSSWVSDEADEGKQRGILIPVLLDSVELPMGFRSIQAADLTDWQPERLSPRFEQLLHDIRTVLHTTPTPSPAEPLGELEPDISEPHYESPQQKPKAPLRRLTYGPLMTLVLVLIVGGGYWGYRTLISERTTVQLHNSSPKPEYDRYLIYLHLGKLPDRYTPSKEVVLQRLTEAGFTVKGVDDNFDAYGPGVDYFHEKDKEAADIVAQVLNALLPNESKQLRSRKQNVTRQEGTIGIWF